MARPSPGTQRVIAILNLLANNPARTFSLTDLINGLKMNRSTCHSLANELVNAGYLYRTGEKQYVLGAAAARLGRAAMRQPTPLHIALPEMDLLASRHDAICSAISLEGAESVLRERVVPATHLDWAADRPRRWPVHPPFDALNLAWRSEQEIERWQDALEPPASPGERRRTREGMAFVREHGFQFIFRRLPGDHSEAALEQLHARDPARRLFDIGTSLDEPDRSIQLVSIASPVFEKGKITFVVNLTGFTRRYTGAEIAGIGADLRAACLRITDYSRDQNSTG